MLVRLFPSVKSVLRNPSSSHFNFLYRNYWRRRDVFSELSSAMQTFENYVREVDKEMNRVFEGMQKASPVKLPRIISPFERILVKEVPVVSTDDGSRTYKLELDMHGIKPDNIRITLQDNELTVSARQEDKREDGSKFAQEKSYHYVLPEGINPDTVRSLLSDGILTIEAPLPALESKEIPVKIENSEKQNSGSETK